MNQPRAPQVTSLICVLAALALLAGCAGTGGPRSEPAPETGVEARARAPAEPGTYEVFGKSYRVLPDSRGYFEIGIASWYGTKFHGKLTANGEVYDMYVASAAHRSLPLPTFVKVTNLNNQKRIVVRVNDRGPFHSDRLIDLSYAAARDLDFVDFGTAPVVVEAVDELNYPEEIMATAPARAELPPGHSYYLQLGAFAQRDGAERLQQQTQRLMASHDLANVEIRILSEESPERTLHKVWMGPLYDEQEREEIVALVEGASLAKPLRVQVD